jgi:hypothetical protein
MNINAFIDEVVIRIVKGERIRAKLEYKNVILDTLKEKYPTLQIVTEGDDERYTYIKRVSQVMPGFSPEDMARATHDCNGMPIASDEGVVTGYGMAGQIVPDIFSVKCLAKKVIYSDANKNEYHIGTNKVGGLFVPHHTMEDGRTGWVRCDKTQFQTYLTALQTGRFFDLGSIRNELGID